MSATPKAKNLTLVLATSLSMTMASMGAVIYDSALLLKGTNAFPLLERVPYIHYSMRFKKDQLKVQALIDSGSEVNTMTRSYAAKLGLKV